MTEDDKSADAASRHRRWVHIALWVANAIVANELAFAFGRSGLRVPAPGFEHYGRLVLLSLPAFLHYAIRPGQRVTVLRVLGAIAKAPFLILGNGLAGGVVLVGAIGVSVGIALGGVTSVLLGTLIFFAVVLALWLGFPRWRHLRYLAWLAPACTAFVCLAYAPPFVITSIAVGDRDYLVEAGLVCMPSDPVFRVCAVTPLLAGVLEWWRVLDVLPSSTQVITMRGEGRELVVEYQTRNSEASSPATTARRIRIE